MVRLAAVSALALALSLAVSAPQSAAAAHDDAVIQVIAVSVKPGKLEKYRKKVKKLVGIQERLGTTGTLRMWQATVGGPDTGTVLVAIEYPSSAAWAADSAKVQADPEWRKIISRLDRIRTLEGSAVWRDVSPNPVTAPAPGSGGVLAITGVQVRPGKLRSYLKRVDGARKILERLGLESQVRLWHAELAGPNTGNVAVGIEYVDLAAYVAEQGKLSKDREWRRFISGLDDIRTLGGRWLYQEITP